MEVFAKCTAAAILNCSAEKINITDWLFTLKDHEYQFCSKAHIAGGISSSKDGKRMSINVEKVADNLLIQHYIEEIGKRKHCKLNSISDSISPLGKTKLGVTWELKIMPLSNDRCEIINNVVVTATPDFLVLLKSLGIVDFNDVKKEMLKHLEIHNNEETPLFASDIEKKALTGIWD